MSPELIRRIAYPQEVSSPKVSAEARSRRWFVSRRGRHGLCLRAACLSRMAQELTAGIGSPACLLVIKALSCQESPLAVLRITIRSRNLSIRHILW